MHFCLFVIIIINKISICYFLGFGSARSQIFRGEVLFSLELFCFVYVADKSAAPCLFSLLASSFVVSCFFYFFSCVGRT